MFLIRMHTQQEVIEKLEELVTAEMIETGHPRLMDSLFALGMFSQVVSSINLVIKCSSFGTLWMQFAFFQGCQNV